MTREQVLNSVALKKRFCRDCNIPIVVYDNPYFYERLEALDTIYDGVRKFEDFCLELRDFDSENQFFEYYNGTKDTIINQIKANPKYQDFLNQDLLHTNFDSKAFISIDMKKANFSAMHHFSPLIFNGAETWEDFMKEFTFYPHIINSKYIRQVVLGACNPKKQIQYESYLMNVLCTHIKNELPTVSLYSLGEDEIIISVPDGGAGFSLKQLKQVVNSCCGGIGSLVRVEMFDLEKIDGTDGYLKVYNSPDGKVEFKCLDAEIIHQVVKHFFNQPITENDLVFHHNGALVKFLKEVPDPWQND